MGLTIHYELQSDLKRARDVRRLVEAIWQHALDLHRQIGNQIENLPRRQLPIGKMVPREKGALSRTSDGANELSLYPTIGYGKSPRFSFT